MWFSIISSIVCFAIATALFTPALRTFKAYQPFAFYFLFEGLWALSSFVIGAIWPGSTVMLWVHFIGNIIFGIYILIRMYMLFYKKNIGGDNSPPK